MIVITNLSFCNTRRYKNDELMERDRPDHTGHIQEDGDVIICEVFACRQKTKTERRKGGKMKLVIDIPDHVYEHAKSMSEDGTDEYEAMRAISKGEKDRAHGEWIEIEDNDYSGGGYWKCSVCSYRFSFSGFNLLNHFGICPNCGASMQANDRQVTSKLKQPCPCETCQTAIDRCGCQMNLCSDYQKWKEGETE